MGTQFVEDVLVVICFDVITVDEIRVEVSTKIGVSDLVVIVVIDGEMDAAVSSKVGV